MDTAISAVLIAAPLAFLASWLVSKAVLRQQRAEPATAPTPETSRDFDPNATIQRPDGRTLLALALVQSQQLNTVDMPKDTLNNSTKHDAALQNELRLLKEALTERDHGIAELKRQVQDLPDLNQLPELKNSASHDPEEIRELAQQLESSKHENLVLSGQLLKAEALADRKLRHMVSWRNRTKPLVKQCRQQRRVIKELREQLRNEIVEEKPGLTVEISADDLQVLRGIGPALEKRLNSQGIYCYRQIAALTETDLVELGQSVGIGKNRMLSAEWLAQARELTSADSKAQAETSESAPA